MTVSSQGLPLDRLYPFPLDDFQCEAIAALNAGESVVVSAPTGSGKTLIGEYAIHQALAKGGRVFYTTPLKALSNQKFRDFQAEFGAEQVGLVTGDISVNRTASILVMTTEIFRNILYGTLLKEEGTSLDGVEAVVLDECHYMNDRQRGTVWEESIIYCPPQIQLIALSATIANADQLTAWMSWVHGPTRLVVSDNRPVPLRFHFINAKGFFPLLNSQQTKLNPKLKDQGRGGQRHHRRGDTPSLGAVIEHLYDRDLLPAIYFIFSRRGCDQSVAKLDYLSLVTPEESERIQERMVQTLGQHRDFVKPEQWNALTRGIAAHHAGLLPLWKSLVEELYQQGLIKVVFATETLAAGINMPARTTLISSLSKRTDSGHRLLTPSEFLQMAGRAGRRGMDVQGYVVTLQTAFEGPREAAYLATATADPLVSQFTPSYGMVLNLLQTRSLAECQQLIERSFGQYLSLETLAPQQQAIADLQQSLDQLHSKLATVNLTELHQYRKLQERLKVEERLLYTLQIQADAAQSQDLIEVLAHVPIGTILGLRRRVLQPNTDLLETLTPLSAVLITPLQRSGQFTPLACLTQANTWLVVPYTDVVALYGEHPHPKHCQSLPLPASLKPRPGQRCPGTPESEPLAAQIPDIPWEPAPEVLQQYQRLQAVETQLTSHPAHASRKQHSQFLRVERRVISLAGQLQDRKAKLRQQVQRTWSEFLALVEILQHFQALEGQTPTPLGNTAGLFRGENELWLGMAFASGIFDALAPQQLAAVTAALVSENNRNDTVVKAQASAAVLEALHQLRPLRRQLIQQQHRLHVTLPVLLELELVGLVELWALEEEWSSLCLRTTLDEGDIVRTLRRTIDVLSQIPHIPGLSQELHSNARRAKLLMERFPIQEDLKV